MKIMSDTNIALRLHNEDSPQHSLCVEAVGRLQDAKHALCFCAQALIEYWSVATRPANVNGFGQRPADVLADVTELRNSFALLPEPPDMAERWLALVSRYDVSGRQVHDARLAALMLAHGVTHLLMLNGADFAHYEDIVCVHPSDVNDVLHDKP